MFLIVKQMLNNLTYHPAGLAKLHPILCSLQFIVFMWDDLFVCFIFILRLLANAHHRCPECDGAGFVRKSGVTLRANAARKDQAQIVCARCNGLGKLNQVDK